MYVPFSRVAVGLFLHFAKSRERVDTYVALIDGGRRGDAERAGTTKAVAVGAGSRRIEVLARGNFRTDTGRRQRSQLACSNTRKTIKQRYYCISEPPSPQDPTDAGSSLTSQGLAVQQKTRCCTENLTAKLLSETSASKALTFWNTTVVVIE